MRTLNLRDPNPFYAPASDECWVSLAKEIMNSYALKYMYQVPVNAFTQDEYDRLDKKTYAPQRRSILRNIKNGPLRNVVDMKSIYAGLESKRLQYKKSMNIKWTDTIQENPDNL